MTKSALYTRTGDSGSTSLVGGARAPKDCPRLEAYGTLDEFSSFLGVVLSMQECPEKIRMQLLDVQNMLFNVGGYLACEVKEGECPPVWVLCDRHISILEERIDALDALTPKVNAFVLPGGCMLAAHTHVARAVCRRAERRIIALAALEYVDPTLIRYVNRLSDYLFILARYFNYQAGVEEIIWKQEKK